MGARIIHLEEPEVINRFRKVEKKTMHTISPKPLMPEALIHAAPAAPRTVGMLEALNR